MAYFARDILAQWTQGDWINENAGTRIEGFSIDSRQIDEKEMFIALRAPERDGHDYVIDAERRGATAALTEQCVSQSKIPQLKVKKGITALQMIAKNHRLQFEGPVVGITGSCGKTSTKDLLAHLLGESRVLKTKGNLNNHLGVPLTLLRLDAEKHAYGVIEAGINSKGEMELLADLINPTIGLVTMIGRAHLELLDDLESVATEKAALLRDGKQKDAVVYPASCLRYQAFRNLRDTPNQVLTPLGMELPSLAWINPVYYWCLVDESGFWKLFIRENNGRQREFRIPGMSAGMRQNLALALITASRLGTSDEKLQEKVLTWYPSDNRGQILRSSRNWIYSDCYNANPDSMKDSLGAFNATFGAELPRLYVLGSMFELGKNAASYHRDISAKLNLRTEDRVICVGRHAGDYASGLRAIGRESQMLLACEKAEAAIAHVHGFEGAVFLKGSRANRLETLIPANAAKIMLDSGKLC
jgi:UDP-N-acetylmuramoyl-tripeptide--D-alanyl-D-alanine ligase